MPIPTNGAGLIGALATPRDNFAARNAARQEGLQLSSYLTQQSSQDLVKEQQAAAQAEQALQQMKSLPFVGSDIAKLKAYMRTVEKDLFTPLKERYNGNFKEFWAAQGPAWMQSASTKLQQQPFYQQAIQNRESVVAAKAAIADGKVLVGSGTSALNYRTGEQDLEDFMAGRADSFKLKGAYKPEDDLKALRETYAPNAMPWQRVAISEAEKQAHLINTNGAPTGADKYYRQHMGIPTYYKTDSILKKFDFERDAGRYNMEQQRLRMSISDHAQNAQLRGQQMKLNDLKIKAKSDETNGTSNGIRFDQDLLSRPTDLVQLKHDGAKKLPHSNTDLGNIHSLAGVTLFGEADKAIERQLGLQRTKTGFNRGNIQEAFTTANGTGVFDLKNSQFAVSSVNPKVYYNPRDINSRGMNPQGVKGYAQVTLQFGSPYEAEKAGLYDPNRVWGGTGATSMFDSETQTGAGVYNPQTMQATVFVPMGDIDGHQNKFFMKTVQKNMMGQKAANEAAEDAPYIPAPTY